MDRRAVADEQAVGVVPEDLLEADLHSVDRLLEGPHTARVAVRSQSMAEEQRGRLRDDLHLGLEFPWKTVRC